MASLLFMVQVAALIAPSLAGLYNYHVFPRDPIVLQNGFHSHGLFPRNYPFHPIFSYNFNTGNVPQIPVTDTSSAISQLIYSNPADTYRGFSYRTVSSHGGGSEVIFVTGPESKKLMERTFELLHAMPLPTSTINNQSSTQPESSTESNTLSTSTTTESSAESKLSDKPHSESSVYRVQLFPSNVFPFYGAPIHPYPIISSYHHRFGGLPNIPNQENAPKSSSSPDQTVEGQESMISEVGTVALKSDDSKNQLIDNNSIDSRAGTVTESPSGTTESTHSTDLPSTGISSSTEDTSTSSTENTTTPSETTDKLGETDEKMESETEENTTLSVSQENSVQSTTAAVPEPTETTPSEETSTPE